MDIALTTELTAQHLDKPIIQDWLVHVLGLTNPSLLIKDDEAWMFLRRFSMGKRGNTEAYISDLVFASMPLNEFRHMGISNFSLKFEIAPDARLQAADSSMTECLFKVCPYAFGPEDPRMFAFGGKVYMYSVSTDIAPKVEIGAEDVSYSAGRPMCAGAHGMYPHLAEILEIHPKIRYGPSIPLIWDGMGSEEKGWSMFQYHSATDGEQLLAVYSIIPHIVLKVNVTTGKSTVVSNTSSKLLDDNINAWQTASGLTRINRVHGGAGVVLMERTPQQEPYYLSVLHFFYKTDHDVYVSYAYKFRAEPPFDIIDVAKKQLPLKVDEDASHNDDVTVSMVEGVKLQSCKAASDNGGIAYVSTVAHDNGDVVIGYGQSDRLARIYRHPSDDFEQQFFG